MSETNGETMRPEMEAARQCKLTEKALLHKIETIEKNRKGFVNKIKALIPEIKELMKQRENVLQIKESMEKLDELCESAHAAHNEFLPLLPHDEVFKQSEWFSSIMKYAETFKSGIEKWIDGTEQQSFHKQHIQQWIDDIQPEQQSIIKEKARTETNAALGCLTSDEQNKHLSNALGTIEDLKPSDSASNVGTRKSALSMRSTTSSRLKAEAELAALAARQKLLKERHALEEEEERLRKRKEQLQLDTEIAEKMAKLDVLKSESIISRRSKRSDGMNSYITKSQPLLNVNASEFLPSASFKQSERNENEHLSVKPIAKENNTFTISNDKARPSMFVTMPVATPQHQHITSHEMHENDVLGIMKRQNEITTLLIQQQCLTALPKREVPIFDGDPLKYHTFIKAFENAVERNTSNNSDRLYFLEQHTRGSAKELVKSCQYINPEHGYARAKTLLKQQYGNEQKVASCYMEKALTWPSIKTDDVKALQDYSLFLRGCCNAMEDVQYLQDLDMPSNMLSLIKKLPYKLRDRWRSQACELQERQQRRARFYDIADFIEKQVNILTDPVFGNIQDSPNPTYKLNKSKFQPRSKGASFATSIGPVENNSWSPTKERDVKSPARNVCICCGAGHTLNNCAQLAKMTHDRKIEILKENGICFGCLYTGHISKQCRKRLSCSKCHRKHPTVLHREPVPDVEQPERSTMVCDTLVSSGLTGAGDQDCKLPIVPVQVKSKMGSKSITTYAFLDQGSTAVFCTESLMHKLNITGRKGHILLRTMGQEKVVSSNIVSGLEVAALEGNDFLELPRVYTQESMPVYKENIPTKRDLNKWPHLKHIHLPQINEGIELLIGTNVPKALEPLEVVCSVDGGPFATRTMLGWTVNGPLGGSSGEMEERDCTYVTVNRVSVVNLDDLWQQQYRNDFPENCLDEEPAMSREDLKFMNSVTNTVKHLNGHYQISLPLRHSTICMPNNKKIVEQRLQLLKRKLKKDPAFFNDYYTFMNELFVKNYAEKVPDEERIRNDGKVWYIPHHGVYHPVKRKLRVVFDCGATYQGTSLNAQLLQGPDQTSSLIGVVTRFRKEPVVMMADIEAMFHQVHVTPEDTDLLRFLWWQDGDLEQPPAEYRMRVHLFGATSSPSCANYALRKCAEDYGHLYSKEAINGLNRCFYVDDCLVSVANEEKAVSLHHELVSLCSEGGFCLSKWISNKPTVLKAIPSSYKAKCVEEFNMELDHLPVERVLGVEWSIESDSFKFKVKFKDRPPNRRGILSTVASIYDPLGMLSPVILTAKKILRDLCRREVGWDDPVPKPIFIEWSKFIQQLHLLDRFEVNRCLKPQCFGEVSTAQLHHFCDASENGYGAVTYLVSKSNNSKLHCAFVMGKSRVAPLKSVTIPRMELIAAAMASRMDALWKRELDLDLVESVFWTDSESVLKYIQNETTRYKVFVANRVSQILKVSCAAQWRYVDTACNPADIASRGVNVEVFLEHPTWLSGPHFLLQPESEWPVSPQNVSQLSPEDPEIKRATAVNAIHIQEEQVSKLFHYFSTWMRLKKAVAWILTFKDWLLSCAAKRKQIIAVRAQSRIIQKSSVEEEMKRFKKTIVIQTLTVEQLEKAELAIVKYCQHKTFPEELVSLEKGQPIKTSSHLRKLCPQLQDGVLRVGGRLSKSSMPLNAKHPIIMAKDLHVSELILRHVHEEVGHAGRNHVLSRLRERYWITGVSTAIRRMLSKCIICRRLNALPVQQQMADLPCDRIVPDEPPFTRVGVDYFGPFEVKSRRSMVKRYGVIFTCLAIRAIHIEVAQSLDTDSFINALRRFIARRGQVKEMRSDNGTNFTGAERELKAAVELWNQKQVSDVMLQRGIKWSFNPPAGSHHGGSWERLIRSIRKVLNSTLKVQCLDEEGLHTLLCEAESIINGRPITKASLDLNDLEALTPNHLLLLKTSPILPPGVFEPTDMYASRRWRQIQYMSNLFWKRWVKEYLPQLQERQKWTGAKRNLAVGDLVLVMDNTAPRNSWPMGRVIETFPDKRGLVRQVRIKTKTSRLDRPITKICLLQEAEAC